MAAGNGLRSQIRDLLARPFRNSGVHEGIHHKFTRPHKIGDYVDIKVNGAVHEAIPQKFYDGRIGRVWKVTKRTIGVEINEQKWWYRFGSSSSTRLAYGRADLEHRSSSGRGSIETQPISHYRGETRARRRKSETVWHSGTNGNPGQRSISSVLDRTPTKNRVIVPGS
ncbi:60S ribosomal protein L21-like [Juglans regia]|uniref:60S ribosomal protein L21-like n=1 Tax=Juglans regia TaxID=51240 RepID=A0A6P9F0M3_JUGRE|nr:60S ribosomal protein L21-like [Juglans regia]